MILIISPTIYLVVQPINHFHILSNLSLEVLELNSTRNDLLTLADLFLINTFFNATLHIAVLDLMVSFFYKSLTSDE